MGFRVDKTANLFPEGLALVEVAECTTGYSKKPPNNGYFKVKLRDVHSGRTMYEIWMMEGAGQGMTVPKLAALELDLDHPVEPLDLVGQRMIARIKHRESEEYGAQAQIAKAWPVSKPPAEWTAANPEPGSPDLFDGKDDKGNPAPPAQARAAEQIKEDGEVPF